ncbi:MAG: hypothetical protein PHR83_13555 [Paludibacter sp.]|nr:hypothetical protein [Paludibacter sp.]
MKPNIKIFTLLVVLTTSCLVLPRQTEAQQSSVSIQVFYDELSPYGQWIDYADYGYVWIPDVDSDFVPYSTEGHWIMTDYGWTWASDYDWGWAAFHYGRWSFTDSFGWFWVPDNEWGPAWVNWRQSDGYYGWSPMEPGVTVSMSFDNRYDRNYDHWMFVRERDFDRPNINQYYVNRQDHDRIIRNSSVINNTYSDNSRHSTYVTGPSRTDIQNATGRRIVPMTVQNNSRPGKEINNGRLQIYRPQIDKNSNGRRATPTRVTNQNEVKQRPTRDVSNPTVNSGSMQERPSNRVIQDNNNRQTIPQRNDKNHQNRTTQPSNERKIQTIEPARSIPVDNNAQDRRPNVVTPQNNQQPIQRRNVNEQDNNMPARRSEVVIPQNNPQPVQQRNVNIPDARQQQPGNTVPAKVENKPQPQRVNPTNNGRPVNLRKSVKQEIKKEQQRIPDKSSEGR